MGQTLKLDNMKKIELKSSVHKAYADKAMEKLIDRICAIYSFDGRMYLPYNVIRGRVLVEIEYLKQSN